MNEFLKVAYYDVLQVLYLWMWLCLYVQVLEILVLHFHGVFSYSVELMSLDGLQLEKIFFFWKVFVVEFKLKLRVTIGHFFALNSLQCKYYWPASLENVVQD